MKKIYKSLILKIMILTSFLFIVSFMVKDYKSVYGIPSSNEIISKEETLRKYYELKEENQKLKDQYNDLIQKWANEKIDINNKKASMDNQLFRIIVVGSSLILCIITICGVSLYEIFKKINTKIEEKVYKEVNEKVPVKVAEKIEEEIEEEIDRIKSMIHDLKKDEILMKETKILVISENDEEQKEVKPLLKQFQRIEFIKLDSVLDNLGKLQGYDVIFFNDINGYIKKENITKIKDNNDNAVYFYFNKVSGQFDNLGNENVNRAKSNVTLCSNLLDLIRYQYDTLKNND